MCYNNKCQVNKCGCGETGRRAGLRNSANGVEVRVLSSAPLTYLFELIKQINAKINQKINLVDFFCCLKTILKSSKRKDGV